MPALEAGDLVASAELPAPEAETPAEVTSYREARNGPAALFRRRRRVSLQQDQRPSAELEEWPAVEQEPQSARTPRKGIRFGGQKVLIVDDDIRNVFALTSVLEQHGLSVLYAENGREGIEVLEQHDDVAVVLMDIMMPEMDGYATTTAIRRMPQFAGLPIIALTAKAMKGDREKAIESGASDYVTKPVDPDHLLTVMEQWMRGSETGGRACEGDGELPRTRGVAHASSAKSCRSAVHGEPSGLPQRFRYVHSDIAVTGCGDERGAATMTGTRTGGARESSPGAAPAGAVPGPADREGPKPGRGGRAMVQKAKILLVDDRPENLLALEAILSALDQTLVRASSGEEALKALLTDDFAVILLDVQMPGMDGFETAAHIKRRERTRDIPIIFLTAINHGPHHTFRGYAAGAVDYISKPFDPWVLRAKVSVFVELYMKNCQLREQASLLRLQLEGSEKDSGESKESAGLLAELSARLAAVEEQAEALTKQLNDESTDAAAVATAAHLERKLTGLRRALDALDPGTGSPPSVSSQN